MSYKEVIFMFEGATIEESKSVKSISIGAIIFFSILFCAVIGTFYYLFQDMFVTFILISTLILIIILSSVLANICFKKEDIVINRIPGQICIVLIGIASVVLATYINIKIEPETSMRNSIFLLIAVVLICVIVLVLKNNNFYSLSNYKKINSFGFISFMPALVGVGINGYWVAMIENQQEKFMYVYYLLGFLCMLGIVSIISLFSLNRYSKSERDEVRKEKDILIQNWINESK